MAMTSAFAFAAVAQVSGLTKAALRSEIDAGIGSGVYRSAEIKFAPGQVKVETVTADGQVVETIYRVEGDGSLVLLATETGAAEGDDLGKSGVEVKSVTRDFVEDDDSGDDNGDDNGDDDSGDDDSGDDDNSGSGSGDDESDDDNSGSGSDDSGDDSDDSNDD